MADFLELGYWGNGTGLRHNLGSTGLDPNNGVLYYNVSGFNTLTYGGGSDTDGVSAARAALIRDAFDVYEAVLGIDFVETTSTDDSVVDFFFSDNKSGAYAGSTRYNDGTIYYSYINIDAGWSGGTSTYDDYTLQTIFHEIGHALGLGHQGPYNGSATYANDAAYELDSWQATMMSYFAQTQNTEITADVEFLQTPMAVDWIALDDIYSQWGYGVSNAFTGDTVYGFNTNISASESAIWNDYSNYANRTASTIIDAGGIDTVDFSGYGANQKIDLTVQSASQTYQDSSDIGGRVGNLTLGVGTVIENAIGGSGNDQLIGNAADNVLTGGAGDDSFWGKQGNDTFYGDAGFDTVIYDLAFGAYSFGVLLDAIEVVGEGIDIVFDTVESLRFSDATYSFLDIFNLFGNAAPEAGDDSATVAEAAALTLDVLANDTDADPDALTVTEINGTAISTSQGVALSSGAVVTLNGDGTLDYAQNGAFADLYDGQTGSDSFSYTVADGNGGTDTATVSVTITGSGEPPAAPVANDDSATVAEDAALILTVLDNDSDADGDALSVVEINGQSIEVGAAVTLASGASVSLNADGTLGYAQNGAFDALNSGETGSDSFTYTVSDGTGRSDQATVSITIDGLDEVSDTIGQSGTVSVSQADPDQWHSVSFDTTISNAVVVMGPVSLNDAEPLTTRVRNVTDTGFEFQLDEWNYLDGVHGLENVSWLAVSEGSHTLWNGQTIVAGSSSVGTGFTSVSFGETLGEAVVLAEVTSVNEADAVTTRIRNVTGTGFETQIEEEEALGAHVAETVSWIALETGASAGIEVVRTADQLDERVDSFTFASTFAEAPVLLADMQSTDGGDTSTVRLSALDASGVSLFVEEETSSETELNHTNETAGFVALSGGLLIAAPNVGPVAEDDSATVAEGRALSLDVLANDTDTNGDALSITEVAGQSIAVGGAVTLASGASVTLNADGTLSYEQNGAFDALNTGQSDNDSFTYTVSDGLGGSDQATVAVTIDGVDDSVVGLIGESGTVTVSQSGADQWHSVSFGAMIADAVVVMGPVSFNSSDPTVTRVRNVTDTGFEFQLDEWNYLDGAHTAETIGWLAVSEGSHDLSNGQTLVAGTQSVGTGFTNVNFGETLGAAVVLAEVTSVNEADAVTPRLRNVTSEGFQVQIEEEEALGAHVSETVSWIALETGTGSGLEVALTGDQLTHQGASFDFTTAFDQAPVVLADMQSTDGVDTSALRLTALDTSGLSFFVEEEKSRDPEIRHTTEASGYVAMTDGLIFEDSFLI